MNPRAEKIKRLKEEGNIGALLESEIEKKLLLEFMKAGMAPDLQYFVDPYHIDMAFPSRRVGIECDGHEYHSTDEQLKRDMARDRYLGSKGWVIMRFTGSEIHNYAESIVFQIIHEYFPEYRKRGYYRELVQPFIYEGRKYRSDLKMKYPELNDCDLDELVKSKGYVTNIRDLIQLNDDSNVFHIKRVIESEKLRLKEELI